MLPGRAMLIKPNAGGGGGGGTDPNIATVKLLMGFEGSNGGTTFTDESASPVTFSVEHGSPTTSTANPKFGTAALRANSGWISTPFTGSPKWVPGTSDWTIEFFACHDSSSGSGGYLGCDSFSITRLTSTIMDFYWRDSGGNNHEFQPTVSAVTGGVYNHYCMERNGTTTRCYVDGVMASKGSTGSSAMQTPGSALLVGDNANAAMVGYIDEFRFSHMARYASDSGFTVPTAAYPRS